jgi:glycosyltransferase involved in cell wall biosynthesis
MAEKKPLKKKNILLIGSTYKSLSNFRGYLIKDLIEKNFIVTCSSGDSFEKFIKINNKKIVHEEFYLNRHSLNFFKEIKTIIHIYKILNKIKPDLVISYTIKPNIYVGLILKIFQFKKIAFFPIITGLGHLFYSNKIIIKFLKFFVKYLFRYSFNNAKIIFFQNQENLNYFVNLNLCNLNKSVLIPGSGIDLDYFKMQSLKPFPIVFLMSSRLLFEKGVLEYFNAANLIKKKYNKVSFIFQYSCDFQSKDTIPIKKIHEYNKYNNVEIISEVDDIIKLINKCHVFVLPSYHEGLPRTSIEALALGKPIITTDVPGCRETVINNLNGYLVKAKNLYSLVKAMVKLIKNEKHLIEMSKESRNLAEKKFDYKIVNQIILSKIIQNI